MSNRFIYVFFFVLLFLIFPSYSVKYFDSSNTFKSTIEDISHDEFFNYNITFKVENLVNSNIDYTIEIAYSPENLILGNLDFSCSNICYINVPIQKTIFGNYDVYLIGKYRNKLYEEVSSFNLVLDDVPYDVDLNKNYFIDIENDETAKITGSINNYLGENGIFDLEIFSKTTPDLRNTYSLYCDSLCSFDINLTSNIILGEYFFNVYSPLGDLQKEFTLKLKNSGDIQNNSNSDIFEKIKNNRSQLSNFFLYNSKGSNMNSNIIFKKNGNSVSDISIDDNVDVEFNFDDNTVKKIAVKNANLSNTRFGFEKVPKENINLLNDVTEAFAVNPHIDPDKKYSLTFVARGKSLLKCIDYDFSSQNCYGDFEKVMDTIPGFTYTVEFDMVDPLFVFVNDYLLSPTFASCQTLGGGWSTANCDDLSYQGSTSCPSGVNGENVFCDDTYYETHTAQRDKDAGVRVTFSDISQAKCEQINKVEILYKIWWSNDNKGIKSIGIDADGDGFTPINFIVDYTEPTTVRALDVTNSLPIGETWDCSDFFSDSSTASLEASWTGLTGGSRSTNYDLTVDTLIYRVTYNYTQNPLQIDRPYYFQGENALILGSDLWDDGSNINLTIILPDLSLDYGFVENVSNSSFTFNYGLNDYALLGQYEVFAIQENDSTKNYSAFFNVSKRNPVVTNVQKFLTLGEIAYFTGSNWARNSVIQVLHKYPNGFEESQYINSNLLGEIEYNWTLPSELSTQNGRHDFIFIETNSSYNYSNNFTLSFRPISSSGNLALINDSDNNLFNLGGAGGTQTLDVGFGSVLPTGFILNSYYLMFDYYTNGIVTRELQWLNDTTGTYMTVCTIPHSSQKTFFGCNVTDYVKYNNDYNLANFRLVENGGPSDNWFLDYVYVMRNYSIEPPKLLGLKLEKNIISDGRSNYNIFLKVSNLRDTYTPENKVITVYQFIPEKYTINGISLNFSNWHRTDIRNETIYGDYNGTIYELDIYPDNEFNVALDKYGVNSNSNNSWLAVFNVTGFNGSRFEDLVMVGLDPSYISKNIFEVIFDKYDSLTCYY